MLDIFGEALSGLDDVLSLKRPVAADSPADEGDVLSVKRNLNRSGYYNAPEYGLTPYPDKPLFDGIRAFQKDNDLAVDGVMNPGGETEAALNRTRIAQADPLEARTNDENILRQYIQERNIYRKQPTLFESEPPVPKIKPDVVTKKESVTNIPQFAADPTFDEFRERLRSREGGFVDDPDDDGGPTNQGISQKFLNDFRKQNQNWQLPEKSKNLSEEEIDAIFRHEFYERPKISQLKNIEGLSKAAPKLADHVFDTGVMSGPQDAGRWLQESIDEVMDTNLRTKVGQNLIYDGNIGANTRKALEEAVKQGKAKQISDVFADKRLRYLQKHPDYQKYKKGWEYRVEKLRD